MAKVVSMSFSCPFH